MTLNKKYCLLFLAIFVILLMGVTTLSATEVKNTNITQGVTDNNKLSTPDNYDVDKVVQSSASKTSLEANVKNKDTSDNTNNSDTTNGQTENTNNTTTTNGNDITSKNINKQTTKVLKTDGEGTFTELQQLIDDHSSTAPLVLQKNYKFTVGVDDQEGNNYTGGITISKSIQIIGRGNSIDGSNKARIFNITGDSILVRINTLFLINANSSNADNTDGGAIYVNLTGDLHDEQGNIKTIVNLTQMTVNNSYSPTNGGGAYLASPTVISQMSYFNNTAMNGGAIYGDSDGVQGFANSNFTIINNTATENGGGLYIKGNNQSIANVNFNNNIAGKNGGAVYWEGINGGLENTRYINNTAKRNGGGLYWRGQNGTLYESQFINNTASGEVTDFLGGGDGGAIFWIGSNGNINSSLLTGNTAKYRGGAIFLEPPDLGQICDNITVFNSTFIDNEAGTNGGAIEWFTGATNGNLLNSTFINNTANRSGGSVYWCGSNGTVENTLFANSTAKGISKEDRDDLVVREEILTPYGGNGGAVIWVGADALLYNNTFVDNNANCSGGAIWFRKSSNITVELSKFTQNIANESGGAIIFYGGANDGHVKYSTFKNNLAGIYGGAIDFDTGAVNGTVEYSNFTANVANSSGGAIYWNGENGIITNTNFTNNKALGTVKGQNSTTLETYGGDGGAVMWTGSNGNITNSNFENNEAAYRGGAIYFTHHESENCENITVRNSNFTGNHAGLNGGAVDWGVGAYNATISSSRFISNIAERNGGALYVSGREVHIRNNSYFEDNKALGTVHIDKRDHLSDFNTHPYGIYSIGGGYGGAILWTASTEASADGFINNTNFINNDAVVSGGAVFLIHSINVTVDNSNFTSNHAGLRGGALNFREGAENCSVRNSIFEENTAESNAGAIYWYGPNGIIEGSTFNKNNATHGHGGAVMWTGSNGYVGNTTFTNNYADITGGAIRVESANNDTFNNTNFENNTAGSQIESNGGAIAVGNYANDTVISNSSFDNNKVIGTHQYNSQAREYWDYGSGGAVFFGPNGNGGLIYNSTFFNNSAYANAGAVNWDGRNGQIILSTFTNNTAEKRNGGAVLWEGNVGNITDSKFYNNSAVYAGGALRISGNDIHVNDTLFDNNHDATNTNSWGSAIYITGNRTDISYSNFTNNVGALYAGAVYVNGENATLDHNIFLNNNATAGGSVYINGNNTVLNNSVFNNSKAIGNGSAVTVLGHNATIAYSEFNNNSLPGYGTIYIAGDNATVLYNNIIDNTANYGGAIYVTGKDEIISYSYFKNNTVKYQGGAIYSSGENVDLSYSKFINNAAPDRGGAIYWAGQHDHDTITACDFINNTARDGGAIFWTAGSAYGTIVNCNFDNNTASNNGAAIHMTGFEHGIIRNSSFNNNTAGVGGAIYGMQSDTHVKNITVINSSFIGNNATSGSGGAIYYQYSEQTFFIDSYFENNTAKGSGGAIILNENCDNATIENCTFKNSISHATGGNGGGAIYFRTISDVRINNSKFINNTVPNGEFGGAFYLSNGNHYIIANSTFINNSCDRWGGAFIIHYGNNHTIDNCTFLDNHAREVGGAILYIGYNATLSNSEFNNNSAQEGGAVYSAGISGRDANYIPSIYNSTFTNNTASIGRGGAIVLGATDSNYNATLSNNTFAGNYAKTNGGAVFINANNITATDITATNNEAGTNGGAIYWANMNGTLENAILTDNNASYGGALRIDGTTNLTSLKNVTFINNTASYQGGAINVGSSNQNNETLFEDLIIVGNRANDGGAIYSSAYNLVLSNETIKDNVANRGGALYLRNELTQIRNSNISNNNATTGSAIFANSGSKINIEDSILLDNQAHARDFDSFGKNMANKKISGRFRGNDNYMNAIYVDNGNSIVINVDNTTYLTKGGINNTDTITPYYWDIQEVHQNITMEVYDPDKNLVRTVSTFTTVDGRNWGYFEFNLTDEEATNAQYSFKIYHPENNYYTYYANSISGTLVNVNVATENITYLDDETIDITVTSRRGGGIPTGNVTVTINNTMGYDNITFDGEDVKILDNGHVQITVPGLNASEYTVYVYYNGDETFIPDTNSSTFTVSKAASYTSIGIENYTYNNTKNSTFTVTNRLSEEITGKVLVNITGVETDGTEYSLSGVEVNITMDEEGYIVNKTFELPILNAGNYTIIAYYNGSNNYNASNATMNFTVYKAASVINVTATNVTTEEGSFITIHVEPEISTGEVTVIVYNDPSTPQHYETFTQELTDSVIVKQINQLPAGTYHVLVQYPGDKNHNSSTNSTFFTVSNPVYPIGIQVSNMTYGQSQLINITVPKDTQTSNLVIKLNDNIISYTMGEDGVIVIDTGSLTGIVNDGLLVVGEYKVNVTYTAGEDDKYPSNSTEAVFNVFKAEPVVTVETVNISYGFNETVTINITSYNASGKVNITIFNESGNIYTNYSVTLANNMTETSGIELVLNSTVMVPGNFTVKVEYCNDTNYNDSVVTADFQVASPVISIEADRPNIYVEEFVTLLGTVTDGYGRVLSDGTVNITVYDSMGNLYKNYTVSLNEHGIYKGNRQYMDNGTYTANTTYIYDGKVLATSNSIEFNVNKIHTITNVTVVNSTVYTVTLDVVVTENESATTLEDGSTIDARNSPVTNGTIRVYIGDDRFEDYNVTGSTTRIVLNGTVNITTTETLNLKVVYMENWKYFNSTGINSTTGEEITDFTASPIASNVTVNVNINPQVVNKNVTISGRVFTENGIEVTTGKVNVSIGDFSEVVELTSEGYAVKFNTTNNGVGTATVTVKYLGNKTSDDADAEYIILESTNTTDFEVIKIPTVTNVTILNNTAGNVTLNISVTGDDGNKSMTGNLNITIGGNNIVPVELEGTEYIIVKLGDNITRSGDISVTVDYLGNTNYLPSSGNNTDDNNKLVNITVANQTALLTVTANDTVFVNTTTVNITGTLTDDMGNNLTGQRVDIYVNGTYVGFATVNSTGGYSIVYTAGVLGEMIINASYVGDNVRYGNATASDVFYVIKLNTTVELNVSDINYTQHELVNITINETTATGSVTVMVNSTVDGFTNQTHNYEFEGNIIQLDLGDLKTGVYNVSVIYSGDSMYYGNITSKTFTVNKLADYDLNVSAVNITYGEEEVILVNLPADAKGIVTVNVTGRASQTINLEEGNTLIIPAYELVAGEYEVNISYNDDNYALKTNTTVFNVNKAASNVNVSAVNITSGYNETITVTLPEYEHATGNISVTVYNSTMDIVYEYIIECPENLDVNLNKTVIEDLPNGTYTVSVSFTNDTNYNDSTATTAFNVSLPIITLRIDRPEIYVTERITIGGEVTEADGVTKVTEGYVIVRLSNGTEYRYDTVEDYVNGVNRQYNVNGTYIVNATYYFNDKAIVTSDISSFVVNKIPTNTTVRIINSTYGNVLIDVVVVENATDYTGNVLSGKINVTINDETVQYDILGANTTINITDQITSTGRIDVGVVYNGSFKYLDSTGKNISDTDNIFDHIDVVPMASNLTVTVNESVKINQTVTITGQVYDEYGNIIQNGKVIISVNGMEGQIVDIIDGRYTLTDNKNTTSNATVKVKVTYLGQETDGKIIITPSSNETTFNVEKWPTNTTVKVLNSTVGNVTIDVKIVTDNETANPIKRGVLNISIAGNDYIEYPFDITQTSDNNITIKLPEITTIGNIAVKVVYNGSEVYIESNGMDNKGNEFKNITVTRQDANITVTANVTETFIGQHVNITGNLTNAMGEAIKDTQVLLNITGMNNLIPVWTNSTGGYTYNYIAETIGEILVNATFTDNTNVYNNSTDTTTFNVTKIPTKTNITIVNNTIGNVIIHVNVTNQTDEPVTTGHVKVYDNTTGLLIGEGDLVNGGQDITLNVTTPGKVYINATYLENNIYYASNATDSSKTPGSPDENTTEIDVVKQNAAITINIVENNVTIGEKVVIYGVVTDGNGQLIPTGNITILINDTMHNTTLTNGEYRLDNITVKAGLFHVNATFTGNDNVSSITSRTINFTVNKIPTTTTINIINTTAGHVQIEVSVTNNTGLPVSMGNITVRYTNGTFIANKTLENGKANITIISAGIKTLDVNVTYNENTHYMTSNATASIEVTKNNATITISLNTTNLTIGESVNITGIVRDEMGSIITENVTVTVDNVEYKAEFLENGTYTVTNVTTKAGTFTVNATYTGNEDLNSITSENVEYTVNKIPTTTIVDIMNNTVGNVTINVAITDQANNPITNGNFNITVAGKTTTVKVEGINTTIKLNITQADDIQVSVKYIENDIYMESNGINNATIPTGGKPEDGEVLENITTIKQAANLTVLAIPSNVTIGESVTITGVLKDGMNNTINDEFITITLNGDKYYTTTNTNGEYSITNVTIKEGVVNVTAYYKGNSTVNNQTATTNFTVNKIPTTTLVNITNTTVGNVKIDVIIKDDKNNTVTNGKLNITIQDNSYTVDVTGEVTPVKLNITTSGVVNVTVKYLENEVYLNSTGLDMESYEKDPENADTFNNITVTKINTTITIEEIEPVKAGNSTIIQGKLVDEQGQPINGAYVVIQVDNQKVANVTTNQDGLYTLKLNKTIVGTHNVTSTYGGNNTYIGSEATTTFDVLKIDANISIDPIEEVPVGQNVTITGKLVDEFQEPIKEAEINVTFDGKTQTVTTDKNGNYETKFPTTSVGEKPVNVEYPGSDIYNNATSQSTAKINKITGTINVEVPENTTVNTPVNITGNVTDEEGNPIPNLPVNVTVNNETIPVVTDENGTFTVPTNNTVPGTNNVTVTAGNDTVETQPVNDTFNAAKIDTNVTINPINKTTIGDDAKVTGTLTDVEANPIPNADIVITINGTKINATTDDEGNYEVSYPTTSTGTFPVLVEYKGNETYNPSNAAGVLTVVKQTGIINVEIPENVTPGTQINITGNVTDEEGNPIPNLPVNVTVNNETIPVVTDENGTFTVPTNNTVPGTNNVTVTAGNDTVETQPVKDTINGRKIDTHITINPTSDVVVDEPVNITGTLTDENNNPIHGAQVTVTVDGTPQTVTTDTNGKYTATFPTSNVGEKPVTAEYLGNDKYNGAKTEDILNVVKDNGTISLELPADAKVGEPANITGKITDKDGNPVPNMSTNITVNNKTYPTITDENGNFQIEADNVIVGTNNVTAVSGNEKMNIPEETGKFNATKKDAKLTVDPIADAKIGDNPKITGTLVDEQDNPIAYTPVTITVNGKIYTVVTDENGNYELTVPEVVLGQNNVTVSLESNEYSAPSVNTSFEASKVKTIVTVPSINGIVGEDITLTAYVTDEDGNPVTGGNLVFKLNGRTLREDGRFDTDDANPIKFKVQNGIVTYTMKADLYLRAGKNITASYSGSYKYEAAKGNVAEANIKKRTAQVTVSVTPNPAKQNTDIVFTATLNDITPNATNKTCLTTDAYVLFKINGKTLKDDNNNSLRIKADHSVVNYVYHVPTGTGGVDENGLKDYTVEAVYDNPVFYPDTRNTSVYHVDRSIVNINFIKTSVSNDVLSVKATFTDYENNYLVGDNKICVKINGITYKENGETKYFTVHDGKVDITGIKLGSGTTVKSVMLVTGDRQAYLGARATTTDITTN